MENFKRMNKNSQIDAVYLDAMNFDKYENERTQILQIVPFSMQMTHFDGKEIKPLDATRILVVVEYISKLEEDAPMSAPASSVQYDMDFENYLDTIINKDPFSAKYSGKPIRAVFEAGDEKWLDKALNEMRNEFIRDRLQYIVDRGGYGKIIRT